MLLGEYYHNLDAKGRIIIPTKFRDDLGGTFVMSKGLDGCLYLHPLEEWEKFTAEIMNIRGSEGRKLNRFFFSGSTECEIDSHGRVTVPPIFREYAALEKEAVIVGVSGRAEVWSLERWNSYMDDPSLDPEEIANIMDNCML